MAMDKSMKEISRLKVKILDGSGSKDAMDGGGVLLRLGVFLILFLECFSDVVVVDCNTVDEFSTRANGTTEENFFPKIVKNGLGQKDHTL